MGNDEKDTDKNPSDKMSEMCEITHPTTEYIQKTNINEPDKKSEFYELTNSIAESMQKLTDHFCERKRWYKNFGVKDVTIIIAVIAFLFTLFEFRDTYTKFQQRSRMVQSICLKA